jgi:hypothetical protein
MNTQIKYISTTCLLTGGALIAAGGILSLQALGLLYFLDLGRTWLREDKGNSDESRYAIQ